MFTNYGIFFVHYYIGNSYNTQFIDELKKPAGLFIENNILPLVLFIIEKCIRLEGVTKVDYFFIKNEISLIEYSVLLVLSD